MKSFFAVVCIAACAAMLSSCASTKSRDPLTPAQVTSNDIIIVGSIKFQPEIQYEKTTISTDANGSKQSKIEVANDPLITIVTSKDAKMLSADLGSSDDSDDTDYVRQNDTFIIKTAKAPSLYLKGFGLAIDDSYAINSGYKAMVLQNGDIVAAGYLGKFHIDVPQDAHAIYIGTFIIQRDDNYLPKGYSIKDDYDSAKTAFAARFPGIELVRADIQDLKDQK
jgi:hypothetical protein